MALAHDADFLVYKLRMGLHSTRESAAMRLVAQARRGDNEYVGALAAVVVAAAATPASEERLAAPSSSGVAVAARAGKTMRRRALFVCEGVASGGGGGGGGIGGGGAIGPVGAIGAIGPIGAIGIGGATHATTTATTSSNDSLKGSTAALAAASLSAAAARRELARLLDSIKHLLAAPGVPVAPAVATGGAPAVATGGVHPQTSSSSAAAAAAAAAVAAAAAAAQPGMTLQDIRRAAAAAAAVAAAKASATADQNSISTNATVAKTNIVQGNFNAHEPLAPSKITRDASSSSAAPDHPPQPPPAATTTTSNADSPTQPSKPSPKSTPTLLPKPPSRPQSPLPPQAPPPSSAIPSVRLAKLERLKSQVRHTQNQAQTTDAASQQQPPHENSNDPSQSVSQKQTLPQDQLHPQSARSHIHSPDTHVFGNPNADTASPKQSTDDAGPSNTLGTARYRSTSEPGTSPARNQHSHDRRLSQLAADIPEGHATASRQDIGANADATENAGAFKPNTDTAPIIKINSDVNVENVVAHHSKPNSSVDVTQPAAANVPDRHRRNSADLDDDHQDEGDANGSNEDGSIEFYHGDDEEGIDFDAVKSVAVENKLSMSHIGSFTSSRDANLARDDYASPARRQSQTGGDHGHVNSAGADHASPKHHADPAANPSTTAGQEIHAEAQPAIIESLFVKRSLTTSTDESPSAKRRSVFGNLRPSDDDSSSPTSQSTIDRAMAPGAPTQTSPTKAKVPQPQKHLSALSAMMEKKSGKANPFAQTYAVFSGKADSNAVKLQIFIPFSQVPLKPLLISVKRDATVEEVIGYTLFEYFNESQLPVLPEKMQTVVNWNLRIVEDDGTIDNDFPALDRNRKIQKYAFDQFALCETVSFVEEMSQQAVQVVPKQSSSLQQEEMSPSSLTEGSGGAGGSPGIAANNTNSNGSVFLKVHLYSTLEVKQTTTMQMPLNIPMSEVFDRICRKRKYQPKDYVLKMADTKTDVPLDKTLAQLNEIEFCVLKRASGGAGDIFLRPPDEHQDGDDDKADEKPYLTTEDIRSVYKQYTVVYKHLMGRHSRNLTIDGEYVHLVAAESKAFFDMGKTTNSFHVSTIISCKQMKKTSVNFKLIVRRSVDVKVYELEGVSDGEAREICSRISAMLQLAPSASVPTELS